jgi:putative transposase
VEDVQSLTHAKWECKYHVVWIPKCRKKMLYWELRKYLGETFCDLALQKECNVIEGNFLPGHVQILISIPPKYSVSQVVGYMKGKSAIHFTRTCMGRKKSFTGQNFWGRGYFVSTDGTDQETIREYIRRQVQEARRLDQLIMFREEPPSGGQ